MNTAQSLEFMSHADMDETVDAAPSILAQFAPERRAAIDGWANGSGRYHDCSMCDPDHQGDDGVPLMPHEAAHFWLTVAVAAGAPGFFLYVIYVAWSHL